MRLSYRGINYEKELPILEMNDGEIGGKYRGQEWQERYPRHIPQLQPKLYRQYRGVAYSTRPIARAGEVFVPQWNTTQDSCSVPIQKPAKIVVNEISKTHLENIRQNLERRLQVAKANSDKNLIDLLEQEFQQLVLDR
jgi:hypothetical protein